MFVGATVSNKHSLQYHETLSLAVPAHSPGEEDVAYIPGDNARFD